MVFIYFKKKSVRIIHMKRLIAIVDDELDILDLVDYHLKKSGFETLCFTNAQDFMDSLQDREIDLLILDLMLPDKDGIELTKELKSQNEYRDIPIIMLTARAEEIDRVIGLEIGADDYITKPFSPRELVARVRAVLRRTPSKSDKEINRMVIKERIVLDTDGFKVLIDGNEIPFTSTEFKILELLSKNRGMVFTREEILEHLWGLDKVVTDRTIDVHIRNIRKKLKDLGNLIKNVRGVGYKMDY